MMHYFLLVILAYAPWHGTHWLSGSASVWVKMPGFGGFDLSPFGAFNALSSLGTALLVFILCIRRYNWRPLDILLLLPLLAVVSRMVYWDKFALISLVNTIGITGILLWISAISAPGEGWARIFFRARFVFLISCGVSLFLPLMVAAFGSTNGVFDSDSAGFRRYRAWFEMPIAVSFLSLCGFCWSFSLLRSGVRRMVISGAVLCVGFFTTAFLATHRTALWAIAAFLLTQIILHWKNLRLRYASLGLLLLPVAGQFVGAVGDKNSILHMAKDYVVKESRPRNQTHSSGRLALYPFLFEQAAQRPLLGEGTGATARLLANSNYRPFFGTDPQSEVLRIFLDQGAFGLACVLSALLVFLLKGYPIVGGMPAAFALLPIVLFESPFTHPNWFYVPFFWIMASEIAYVDEA